MPSKIIPAFTGLNTSSPPTIIQDTELQAVSNLDFVPFTGDSDDFINTLSVRRSFFDNAVLTPNDSSVAMVFITNHDSVSNPGTSMAVLRSLPSGPNWISNIYNSIPIATFANAAKRIAMSSLDFTGYGADFLFVNNGTAYFTISLDPSSSTTILLGVNNSLFNTVISPMTMTNGSTTVTGSGFTTTYPISKGAIIQVAGDTTGGWTNRGGYAVSSVVSDTQLTLSQNYTGATGSHLCNYMKTFLVTWGGSSFLINPVHLSSFKERIIVCGFGKSDNKNYLYYTEPGSITDNPATNFWSFPSQDRGSIMASAEFGGRLIIFFQKSISGLLSSPQFGNSIIYDIHKTLGLMGLEAFTWTPYGICFCDNYGNIRLTDGNSVGTHILNLSVRKTMVVAKYMKILYTDDFLYVLTTSIWNGSDYNIIWVYSFSRQTWTQYSGEIVKDIYIHSMITDSVVSTNAYNKGFPQPISTNGTSIYEFTDQNAVALACSFQTKDFTFDDPNVVKIIDSVSFDLIGCYAGVAITITPVTDGITQTGQAKIYTTLADASQTAIVRFYESTRCRRFSAIVSFTANSNSGMAILGNFKINYKVAQTQPDGGVSPSKPIVV